MLEHPVFEFTNFGLFNSWLLPKLTPFSIFFYLGHKFAIFGCSLTHDKRYVVSISNRFLSWDVNTSEVCRDIDPRSDGMILSLALSMDDRFAAAFTTSNQLIIIDIMLGHYIKVERPMEKMDEIVNIAITDKSVIVYNNKYWRSFAMDGKVI